MHVLLVEDERKIAAYVKRGLEEQGYAVDVAYTGNEALDWSAVGTFDTRTFHVTRGGRLIDLAAKEYAVLECLMRAPGRVLSRIQIAEQVWSYDVYNQSNVVDVYIRNLRRKIDDPFDHKLIHTVRGLGYRLAADTDVAA